MKTRRRVWGIIGLAAVASVVAWMAWPARQPVISFLRFEDVEGVRHAFFAFENRTPNAFVFLGSTASLPFANFETGDGVRNKIGTPAPNALPFPQTLQPGESVTFSYPLVGRDGAEISEPFRLCINSQRQGSSLRSALGDLRFFSPHWLVGQERVTSWSEVVTP